MSKANSSKAPKLTQEINFLPNDNDSSSFPRKETRQSESILPDNVAWEIQTIEVPRKPYALLHLLTNTETHACLAACVSEMFCLLPLNLHSTRALLEITRLGDIKLQKRMIQITLDTNTSKEEYMGLLVLAQVMTPFNVTDKPNKNQLKEVMKSLEAKSHSFTAILNACECQVKKLTNKEQLHYMREKDVNIEDVILFENREDLEVLFSKQYESSTSSSVGKSIQIPITKISRSSVDLEHYFSHVPFKTRSETKKNQNSARR